MLNQIIQKRQCTDSNDFPSSGKNEDNKFDTNK